MLIICNCFLQKELKPLRKQIHLHTVIDAARKLKNGLGATITGNVAPETVLKKAYFTSSNGAGRIIFLVLVNKKQLIPVILKLKKNKPIGDNMTIKNPKFKRLLDKNLDLIFADIKNERFQKIEI